MKQTYSERKALKAYREKKALELIDAGFTPAFISTLVEIPYKHEEEEVPKAVGFRPEKCIKQLNSILNSSNRRRSCVVEVVEREAMKNCELRRFLIINGLNHLDKDIPKSIEIGLPDFLIEMLKHRFEDRKGDKDETE